MSKRYHQPQPWNWFVRRPAYVWFMLRELTAVFVGAYLVFLLVLLFRLGDGKEAFIKFLIAVKSPLAMFLHAVAMVAALWHSITWFNLTPKAIPVFFGERRLPAFWIAAALGYLPWIVVTIVVLIVVL